MKNNNKKRVMVGVIVSLILVLVFGVTYAMWTASRTLDNQVLIVAGDIYMRYTNGKEIALKSLDPRDTYDENSYFEFKIEGNNDSKKDIWYDVVLSYGDPVNGRTKRLRDDLLKFRLVEIINGEEKVVVNNQSYSDLQNKRIYVNTIKSNTTEKVDITYRLYMWVASGYILVGNTEDAIYDIDTWNNQVFASINVSVNGDFNEKELDLISTLKEKAYTNDAELIAIDVTDKNNIKKCKSLEECAGKKIEYRYSGPKVNNYIKLTDNNGVEEDWRIIGIFKDEIGSEYIRIVRDSVLPESYLPTNYVVEGTTYKIKGSSNTAYWNYQAGNTSDKNDWSIAGLQYYLNGEQDTSGNKGFLSYLSSDVKKLLEAKKLYLGTITYVDGSAVTDTTKQAYKYERATDCDNGKGTISSSSGFTDTEACRVWNGNAAIASLKVSLMYPSDYGFSAPDTYWNNTTLCNYMLEAKEASWMYNTMSDAKSTTVSLISPVNTLSYMTARMRGDGATTGSFVFYAENVVRPVLNLSGNLTMVYDGDGTSSTSAYKIIAD